jgi:hypothetical protein
MTLEPMLRLIAGVFVTASVLLGMFVHPYFFWFTVFVGLNLMQSAFTNWCQMMTILRHFGVRESRIGLDRTPRALQRSWRSVHPSDSLGGGDEDCQTPIRAATD